MVGSRKSSEVSAEFDIRVLNEQVKALYAKGLLALVTNIINSAVLTATLWNHASRHQVLVWFAVMCAVVSIRLLGWRLHDRAGREPYNARRWARDWVVGAAVTGALWGAAGISFLPLEAVGEQYLVLFVIGGMVAGASASASAYFPGFAAFTAPALAPITLRLLVHPDRMHSVVALYLLVFGLMMTLLSRHSARSFTESVGLRFRNVRLLDDLTHMRAELTAFGQELEGRVATRTKELEQAVSEREKMISVVSHELRTPLSSIKLNQELLSRFVAGHSFEIKDLRRLHGVLSRQVDRMQRLVDDLLVMSRLTRDTARYSMSPVDLRSIVDEAVEDLAPQLTAAGVTFALDVEDGLRGNWDRAGIEQVLVNLMSNAIKYARPPFSLSACRAGIGARVAVGDGGPGISPEDLGRIFAPFERGAHAGDSQGTGLGLYIAERIVRAHGGTIHAESAPGQGSTFIMELPAG
jgi:signal transduction histidine kinase